MAPPAIDPQGIRSTPEPVAMLVNLDPSGSPSTKVLLLTVAPTGIASRGTLPNPDPADRHAAFTVAAPDAVLPVSDPHG